jgi:hypothetical protein
MPYSLYHQQNKQCVAFIDRMTKKVNDMCYLSATSGWSPLQALFHLDDRKAFKSYHGPDNQAVSSYHMSDAQALRYTIQYRLCAIC